MTALQLQVEYLELARKYVDVRTTRPRTATCSSGGSRCWRVSRTIRWRSSPSWTGWRSFACWRATAQRDGLGWERRRSSGRSICSTTTSAADAGCTTGSGASGKVERLTTDEEVERAIMEPPEDTRAYFRGRCISRYPGRDRGGVVGLGHHGRGPRRLSSASRCASRCGVPGRTSRTARGLRRPRPS